MYGVCLLKVRSKKYQGYFVSVTRLVCLLLHKKYRLCISVKVYTPVKLNGFFSVSESASYSLLAVMLNCFVIPSMMTLVSLLMIEDRLDLDLFLVPVQVLDNFTFSYRTCTYSISLALLAIYCHVTITNHRIAS